MKKPIKPQKYIYVRNSRVFDFYPMSTKVSLDYFIDWCKRQIPKKSKDICLSLKKEYYYDDCEIELVLSWEELKKNSSFKQQMISYEKKLAKWKEKNK